MKHWTLHLIIVETYTVKVYVNSQNDTAVIFPLFGRYMRIHSDINALDLATSLLFHTANAVTYSSYLTSLDDTAIIDVTQVA